MNRQQLRVLKHLCREPGLPKWHYPRLNTLPDEFYRVTRGGLALFTAGAYPTKKGVAALAIAMAPEGPSRLVRLGFLRTGKRGLKASHR